MYVRVVKLFKTNYDNNENYVRSKKESYMAQQVHCQKRESPNEQLLQCEPTIK